MIDRQLTETHLSKMSASKYSHTFEVLKTEVELFFIPGKQPEYLICRHSSTMSRAAAANISVNQHCLIHSQGAVFTSLLILPQYFNIILTVRVHQSFCFVFLCSCQSHSSWSNSHSSPTLCLCLSGRRWAPGPDAGFHALPLCPGLAWPLCCFSYLRSQRRRVRPAERTHTEGIWERR